ncbi:hypothetical protein ACEQ8H_004066 [Pleosporales sp. CAS-2024a]
MASYGALSSTLVSTTPTVVPTLYPGDIVAPIESLSQCSQSIIFTSLASSPCAPNDFPCICTQLQTLGVQAKIGAGCPAADSTAYVSFQAAICAGTYTPTMSIPIIVSSSTSSSMPVSSSTSTSTSPSPEPAVNSTVPVRNATMSVPVKVTTTQVVTTNAAGYPTTIVTVVPVPASPTAPAVPPMYTGAGTSMKMGAFAGAIGFFGLVFAGL